MHATHSEPTDVDVVVRGIASETPAIRIAVAKNTLLNLGADLAPVAVSLLVLPTLVRGLGLDRFGLLTLAWSLVGSFSLFDLGIGRALTQVIASHLSRGERDEIPAVAQSGLAAITILGLVGGAALVLVAKWVVGTVFHMPAELIGEAVRAVQVIGACLPLVLLSAGARGILEAYGRFDMTNAVRAPLSIFNFIGPAIVLGWSRSVFPVVLALMLGRFVATAISLSQCARVVPGLTRLRRVDRRRVRELLGFGGWMTVSNVVSPLMSVVGQFLIGSIVSVAAIAFYTTPFALAERLQVIPGALTKVLFPSFTLTMGRAGRPDQQFALSLKGLGVVLFPLALVIFAFAPEGLRLWLGEEFAHQSAPVLRWLIIGGLVNGLALIPFTLVQAAGRADWTAKVHVLELGPYLLLLVLLLHRFGVAGAAAAWTIRVLVDCCLQFVLAARVMKAQGHARVRAWLGSIFALLSFVALAFLASPGARLVATVAILAILPVFAWSAMFDAEERARIRAWGGQRIRR